MGKYLSEELRTLMKWQFTLSIVTVFTLLLTNCKTKEKVVTNQLDNTQLTNFSIDVSDSIYFPWLFMPGDSTKPIPIVRHRHVNGKKTAEQHTEQKQTKVANPSKIDIAQRHLQFAYVFAILVFLLIVVRLSRI